MAVLIALLVVAVVAPRAVWRPASAAAPVASFDRPTPDRFGPDRNHDGVIDYVDGATDATTSYDPRPDSRRVDLNAFPSADSAHATFRCTVVDQPDPVHPDRRERWPGCDGASRWTSPRRHESRGPVVEVNGVSSALLRRDVIDWDARSGPGAALGARPWPDRCRATIIWPPPLTWRPQR